VTQTYHILLLRVSVTFSGFLRHLESHPLPPSFPFPLATHSVVLDLFVTYTHEKIHLLTSLLYLLKNTKRKHTYRV